MAQSKGISLTSYFRDTWYGLLLSLTALVIASSVIPAGIIVSATAVSIIFLTVPHHLIKNHLRLIRLLIGLYLAVMFATEVSSYQNLAHGIRIMIQLIVGALPLTIISVRQKRSYWLSVLNATVIAIGSVALGPNTMTFFMFVFFVVWLILNLNAASLFLSSQDFQIDVKNETLPRGYVFQVMQALPPGFLTALIIFYTFPRAPSFSFGLSLGQKKSSTGYSGTIELGSTSTIEKSTEVAMIVDSLDKDWLKKTGPHLLFRGESLYTFDGTRWQAPLESLKPLALDHGIPLTTKHQEKIHTVTIQLEPHERKNLFYPEVLLAILERSPSLGGLFFSPSGSLYRSGGQGSRATYSLNFAMREDLSNLPQMPLGAIKRNISKDLEPLLQIDEAVAKSQWFQSWTKNFGISDDQPPVLMAKNIKDYFAREYRATLQSSHVSSTPLKDFITVNREGHCEYFASATTLLLRANGIPARVVVGYHGGVYNRLIQALEVRNEHAHAWTEFWIPEVGWYPLDTTPITVDQTSFRSSIALFTNALQYWLRKYVIDYNQSTQRELLVALQSFGKNSSRFEQWNWSDIVRHGKKHLWIILPAGISLTLVWYGLRRTKARREWPPFYQKFLHTMARRGFEPQTGETLRAFHRRILDSEKITEQDRLHVREVDSAVELAIYGPKKTPT